MFRLQPAKLLATQSATRQITASLRRLPGHYMKTCRDKSHSMLVVIVESGIANEPPFS
jgi:hypothetical protein